MFIRTLIYMCHVVVNFMDAASSMLCTCTQCVGKCFNVRFTFLQVLKQAAEKMLNDPHATNEKTAKVFVTVGNLISANESRLEEALYYVSKGVEVLPSLANAHNSRGSVLHKMRRTAAAKAEFEEAIKWNPNYANAHFNLGLVLYQSGDTEQAVREFRKTLQIDPNHTMAQLQMQNMRENGEIPSPGRGGTASLKK